MSLTLPKIFGALGALKYLLKTSFGADRVLNNGDVLTVASGDMAVGQLTVVDSGNGTVSIASNVLTVVGTNGASWDATGVASTTGITRAEGRIYKAQLSVTGTGPADSALLGLGGTSGSLALANRKHTFVFSGSLSLVCTVGNGSPDYGQGAYAATTTYYVAVVLRSAGAYYFIKGGAYSTWTLLVIDSTDSMATLYTLAQCYSYTRTLSIPSLRITETLYPNLVQTVAEDAMAGTLNAQLNGTALDVGAGTWSAPATVVFDGGGYVTSTDLNDTLYCNFDCGISEQLIVSTGKSTASDNTYFVSSVFRYVDDNNLFFANSQISGGVYIRDIYERTSGTYYQRYRSTGGTGPSANTDVELQIRNSATDMTVFFPDSGGVTGTYSSTVRASATKAGVFIGSAGTYTPHKIKSIKVYPVTGYDEELDAI